MSDKDEAPTNKILFKKKKVKSLRKRIGSSEDNDSDNETDTVR